MFLQKNNGMKTLEQAVNNFATDNKNLSCCFSLKLTVQPLGGKTRFYILKVGILCRRFKQVGVFVTNTRSKQTVRRNFSHRNELVGCSNLGYEAWPLIMKKLFRDASKFFLITRRFTVVTAADYLTFVRTQNISMLP